MEEKLIRFNSTTYQQSAALQENNLNFPWEQRIILTEPARSRRVTRSRATGLSVRAELVRTLSFVCTVVDTLLSLAVDLGYLGDLTV